jgi:ABC-type polysaccharide/polyol phosphate transport system ATPase subunit
MSEVIATVTNVSKHFHTVRQRKTVLNTITRVLSGQKIRTKLEVLSNLSFKINAGDKIALIGKNGAGKTTLIRILSGIYRPSAGEIQLEIQPRPLFRSLVGLAGELYVEENVRLCSAIHGLTQPLSESILEEILQTANLGDFRFRKLNELSSGQKERLMMSVFFQVRESFLIFDELFSVIDRDFQKRYLDYFESLAKSDKTIIIASHDEKFLGNICKKALWLEHGRIKGYGDFAEIIKEFNSQNI